MTNVFLIIPIYNTEKYLSNCLDSVVDQTYTNIKIICVNDGSTDKSLSILEKYKERYDNISIFSKPNGGLSSARNYGLDKIACSENDCIMFLDSDDVIEKDYIETMVETMEQIRADIVCSSFSFYNGNNHQPCNINYQTNVFVNRFDSVVSLVEDRTIQSHAWGKLYKSYLWENVRFPVNIKYMEDQATTFKLFCKARNGIFLINNFGYLYRQSNTSLCATQTKLNSGVINSLLAYHSVCVFDYQMFSTDEKEKIVSSARQAFANVFLMMLPRFNKKIATNDENITLKKMKEFARENRIVLNFIPKNKTEKIKKFIYIFFRPFYCSLFKLYLRKK